jgi:tetratricopeptide (TPR) repeat protein
MRTLFLAAALALVVAGPARADETKLSKPLQALGQVTGKAAISAQYELLLAQPDATKKLITEAVAVVEKKEALPYNTAFLLGQAAAKFKDVKAGEALYRVCMADAAKLQSAGKVLQSYGALIDLYFNNRKYAESARVCQQLLELKLDDGKPRRYLEEVNDPMEGRIFLPVEEYDPIRKLRPIAHRMMIQAVAKQGKYDQGLKLVDNLVRAEDTWENRELKGMVLREAGRFVEAAKVYEDVIERIDEDVTLTAQGKDYYTDYYRYLLSGVYVDAGNVKKAAEQLQTLVEKHPDNPSYHNDLGYIWADNNMKLEESEKLIRKALDLDRARQLKANPKLKAEDVKGNGAYLDSLGWVLFKLKRYKEAKVELLRAVEDKESQHLEIYDHLGDVHMALGEREAALAAWRRGIEVAGDSRREMTRKAEVEKKVAKHGK